MSTDASAVAAEAASHATLQQTWRTPGGVLGWFTQVSHRQIGLRFIVTSLVFFVLAGLLALALRLQLAVPENDLLGPERYNQFFTLHGTAMMFFFAVPAMEGFAIYLVPLMLGTRDMAFPRLNAFGYYVYLIAGVVLFIALFWALRRTTVGSVMCRWRTRCIRRIAAPMYGPLW